MPHSSLSLASSLDGTEPQVEATEGDFFHEDALVLLEEAKAFGALRCQERAAEVSTRTPRARRLLGYMRALFLQKLPGALPWHSRVTASTLKTEPE